MQSLTKKHLGVTIKNNNYIIKSRILTDKYGYSWGEYSVLFKDKIYKR